MYPHCQRATVCADALQLNSCIIRINRDLKQLGPQPSRTIGTIIGRRRVRSETMLPAARRTI